MPEHPLVVDEMLDVASEKDLTLDEAIERHGVAAVLDATAKLVEDIFCVMDSSGELSPISEENLVLAKGALESTAKGERGYASPQEKP